MSLLLIMGLHYMTVDVLTSFVDYIKLSFVMIM